MSYNARNTKHYVPPHRQNSHKSKHHYKPYKASLKCYVTVIFKSKNPLEYCREGGATLIPQKQKGLWFIQPNSKSVKFFSYYPDNDGNRYVYIAHIPDITFERAFGDQICSEDYDGTINAEDYNFWFDPLEIDMYNRILERMDNDTTQYYKVLQDGSFQLHYSNFRGELE